MKALTLECETVTPLFLFGAYGNIAELRASSLKGIIRYWWRAVNADLDIDTLRESEQKIFGGTSNSGGDSNRSKVILRIMNNNNFYQINNKLTDEIHDLNPNTGDHCGISYLLYSVSGMTNKPYIKSGTKFLIKISASDDVTDDLMKSLIAFQYFGALGSRSRRGAGSISMRIKDSDNSLNVPYKEFFDLSNINSREDLKKVFERYGEILQSPVQHSYSVLKGSHIYIFNKCSSWIDALNVIGNRFRNFRKNNQGRVFETPCFGIPIMHRKSRSFFIAENNKGSKINRRPSSLLFKVLKTSDKGYFPMIIKLNGDFLPHGSKILNSKTYEKENYDDKIVGEFLNGISSSSLEVTL